MTQQSRNAWLFTAQQVNKGIYDDAPKSAKQSILIGLRSAVDPVSRKAVARLERLLGKTTKPKEK